MNLAPGFPIPPNSDYKTYHNYIDEVLPAESPYLYGLHPNAEIGFLTATSDNLFRTVLEMQPRDAGAGSGGGQTREEKVGYQHSDSHPFSLALLSINPLLSTSTGGGRVEKVFKHP